MQNTNFTAQRPTQAIQFMDAFFRVDNAANTVAFTEAGRAYYEGWFSRYGFRLNPGDADAFIETVMFINRQGGQLEPGRLQALIDGGSLPEREADMWRTYLSGDFTRFSKELDNFGGELQAVPSNVVPLFRTH